MTNTQTISLHIDGMHCGNCVAKVARALTSVSGVEVQRLQIGSATLRLDNRDSTVAELLSALSAAGYPATVASE